MVIAESLVSEFRREGWIKLPRLIGDEQLARLQEIYEIEEATGSSSLSGEIGEDGVKDSFAYQTHPDMTKMWSNRIDLRLRWPELQGLVRLYSKVALALIGCPEVLVFWDKTFTKPPIAEGTRQSVWHQDLPYNPIDRRGFLSVWIAVEDVSEEMGAMRFIPRSHRLDQRTSLPARPFQRPCRSAEDGPQQSGPRQAQPDYRGPDSIAWVRVCR